MRAIGLVLVLTLAAVPPRPVLAQDASDAVIKVNVDLVNVLCTVRGKNGQLLGNLEKPDFRLYEDGKEQEIKYFTRETDLPLTLGLLVDVSPSQERLIETERQAANQFFQKVLRPKDQAFLISFGHEAELLQDSTNSASLLRKGLDDLKLNGAVGGLQPGPVPTAQNTAGTILYDAVFLAADERLRSEVGRKAIIVITDGVDTGSRKSRDEAIAAAQKADAIIYGIYYYDAGAYGYYGGGGGGDGVLRRMAEETGGRMFRVDRRNTLDDAFREIQEEMRSQYALAYSPSNEKKDGTFRKIEIKMASKDQKVQTRKGYYAIESQN